MSAGLEADVALRLGVLDLEVALAVPAGETVAVLGPNGAGKTTLLRALAGLVPLDAGRVALDGIVLEDAAAGRRAPSEHRPVGVVFQDHRLFPHLSALDNVAFGLRARGVGRAEARRRAGGWLERVGIARAGDRPGALSGGQAQRVALARALATEPKLLLLDEPLSALDATARAAARRDLRAHLGEAVGARLVVTHDAVEAAAVATRLVVVEQGRVVQQGTLAELTARPRSRYVADLVGVNLFAGRAAGTEVEVGRFRLTVAEPVTGEVLVAVPPRAVALHRRRPEGSARNVWEGRVDAVEPGPAGDRARVAVGGPLPLVAEVTTAAARDLGLDGGGAVWLSVKATEVAVFPS
ncbi:MAG TPA: ABC transporter ATP-binding protein [Acidimicrobiales bacterium]|nr:ABC transporter ATP-binding protein [Acidimicrobiales bacterium]